MAQAPTQDFIVNSGLTVLGTSVVTSPTGNTSTLQVDGGAAIAKNLIVGSDAEIYGDLTVRGNLPSLSVTTGTFTNLTVTGASALGISTTTQLDVAARLAVGGLSQLNNATLASGINSTSSTTGALQVTGGVGIQQDLWVGGRAFVSGYEVLTTATIIASTLEAVAQQGSSTTVAISILNTVSSTSSNSGALTVAGGVGVGGAVYAREIYDDNNRVVTSVIATGSDYIGIVNLISTGTSTSFGIVNLGVQTLIAGTDIAVSSNTGTITVQNTSTLQSVSSRGSTTDNAINITNATSATSTTTGALVVTGGVGIGGRLYANELYISTASYINDSLVLTTATVDLYASKTIIIAGTDTSVNTSSGIVTVWNTSTLQTVTDRGSQTSNAVEISNITPSLSANSGALIVAGGVGVGENLYVGGTIYGTLIGAGSISTATNLAVGTAGQVPYQTAPGVTSFYGPGIAGNVLVSNGTAAPSYNNTLTLTSTLSNTTTVAGNALQVVGGVGINGSLFVDGPAYFANNVVFYGTSTSIFSTATVYTDNYIDLHFPSGGGGGAGVWTVDDGLDIGHIYHHYKESTGDEHGALIWHNASDELRWYMGGVEYLPLSQLWDVSTAIFGVFRAGTIHLQNTTTATSTSTGTLVVAGGIGVGKGIYVGGPSTFSETLNVNGRTTLQILNATSATFSGTLGVTGTSVLNGLSATNIVASGTLGVTGTTTLRIINATSATFSGTVSVAGVTTVTNTTAATSTATGALQIRGGVGIGGALYVQQTSYVNGAQVITTATLGSYGVSTITAGTDTVVSASTGSVVIWNTSTLQSITNRGSTTTNQIVITNTSTATSAQSGALQVVGGVGIGGNLYVSGISVLAGVQSTNIVASGTLGVTGTTTLGLLNAGSATFSGTLGVTGTSVLNGLHATNIVASGTLGVTGTSILAGVQATNIVASGTLGVTGTSVLGVLNATSATLSGTLGVTGTSIFAGLTTVTNVTSATSTNTGALQVRGGVGIGGALYVQQTSYVAGSQVVTVATLGNFGVSTITAGTDTQVSTSTGAVVVWSTSTLQSVTDRGAATTNAILITNTTSATSTATGALRVQGGVGIGGSVYVGNRVGFGNAAGASAVYQVYNAATNSLDTVFE